MKETKQKQKEKKNSRFLDAEECFWTSRSGKNSAQVEQNCYRSFIAEEQLVNIMDKSVVRFR